MRAQRENEVSSRYAVLILQDAYASVLQSKSLLFDIEGREYKRAVDV